VYFTEPRTAINAGGEARGLAPFAWTDPNTGAWNTHHPHHGAQNGAGPGLSSGRPAASRVHGPDPDRGNGHQGRSPERASDRPRSARGRSEAQKAKGPDGDPAPCVGFGIGASYLEALLKRTRLVQTPTLIMAAPSRARVPGSLTLKPEIPPRSMFAPTGVTKAPPTRSTATNNPNLLVMGGLSFCLSFASERWRNSTVCANSNTEINS